MSIMTYEDRSISVPPGALVKTGYVKMEQVRLACRDRMAVGDVDRAYQRRIQLNGHQPWPCPRGRWDDGMFVIEDGRHDYVAALMLGCEYILVAWLDGGITTVEEVGNELAADHSADNVSGQRAAGQHQELWPLQF